MIYYIRDEKGDAIGFIYNNTKYYYKKNFQGDVLGIYDSNYNLIVNYTYDSWGKLISITDSNNNVITDTTNIGYINPIRYRSYYYDSETKLYYLNNRYYNPEWGRFINCDSRFNKSVLGNNIYIYCYNNPVMMVDINGCEGLIILGFLVAGALINSVSKMYFNKISGRPLNEGILGAIISGAAGGLMIFAGINPILSAYITAYLESVVNEEFSYLEFTSYLNNTDYKKLTTENVYNSYITTRIDTIYNGTINALSGEIVGTMYNPIGNEYVDNAVSTFYSDLLSNYISKDNLTDQNGNFAGKSGFHGGGGGRGF